MLEFKMSKYPNGHLQDGFVFTAGPTNSPELRGFILVNVNMP